MFSVYLFDQRALYVMMYGAETWDTPHWTGPQIYSGLNSLWFAHNLIIHLCNCKFYLTYVKNYLKKNINYHKKLSLHLPHLTSTSRALNLNRDFSSAVVYATTVSYKHLFIPNAFPFQSPTFSTCIILVALT